MSKHAQTKLIGRQVRLRPLSLRLDRKGNRLPATDDLWTVVAAGADGIEIRHTANPELDCLLDSEQAQGMFFESETGPSDPGILRLNGKLMVWPDRVEFGPA